MDSYTTFLLRLLNSKNWKPSALSIKPIPCVQKAYLLRFAYPRLYAGAVFDDYLQEEGKATHSPTPLLNVELIVCYAAVAIVS